MKPGKFIQEVKRYFLYLVNDYHYELTEEESDAFRVSALFRAPQAAVRISYEPREGGIFIRLIRLVNGEIPPYPIHVDDNTAIHSFELIDLVTLRDPDWLVLHPPLKNPTDQQIKKSLELWALALKKYADDFLQGDFSSFPLLHERVKQRAKLLQK